MENERTNVTAALAQTHTDQGTDRAGRMAPATHQGLSLHGHRQRGPLKPDRAPEVSPRPGRRSRPAPSDSCLPGVVMTALPGQASAGALRSALHLGRADCQEGRAQNLQVTGKRAPLATTDSPPPWPLANPTLRGLRCSPGTHLPGQDHRPPPNSPGRHTSLDSSLWIRLPLQSGSGTRAPPPSPPVA